MIDLINEAASIQEFIESKHWDFFFIGGLTVQVWGQPRLTQDIDLTVFTELTRARVCKSLLETLQTKI
jgi:hypothetical protein